MSHILIKPQAHRNQYVLWDTEAMFPVSYGSATDFDSYPLERTNQKGTSSREGEGGFHEDHFISYNPHKLYADGIFLEVLREDLYPFAVTQLSENSEVNWIGTYFSQLYWGYV